MTESPTLIEFKESVRDAFGYLGPEFAFREVEPPAKSLEANPFIVWFANTTTLVQVEESLTVSLPTRQQPRLRQPVFGGAVAEGQFVLTTGVYFPPLAARLALFPPSDVPEEPDCQVRTWAMPPGQHWWKVRAAGAARPDPDAEQVLQSVFSWLDRWADQRAARTNARATREIQRCGCARRPRPA
jgi:hypothetical protein